MRRNHTLFLTALVMAVVGCASASAGEGRTSNRNSNLLTAEAIQQAPPGQSVYDFIRGTRPNWLQARGVQSLGSPVEVQPGGREPTRGAAGVVVYLDGTRAGGPDILRQILVQDVEVLQYLGATEATSRFGTNYTAGAILVTTRRQP